MSSILLIVTLVSGTPVRIQSVDDVVALHLKSRGGAERWNAVTTIRLTGKVMAGELELAVVTSSKRPNLARQEIRYRETTIVSGFDGTSAWTVDPLTGAGATRDLPGALLEILRQQADFDGPLVGYKEKGHGVALLGEESVGGRRVYKVRITTKAGELHEFIDAETGAALKRSAQVEIGGTRMVFETAASDHRLIEGILVPHVLQTSIAGQPAIRIVVEKVEFNVPMEDESFKKPQQGQTAGGKRHPGLRDHSGSSTENAEATEKPRKTLCSLCALWIDSLWARRPQGFTTAC
jgi:hypothetical protein